MSLLLALLRHARSAERPQRSVGRDSKFDNVTVTVPGFLFEYDDVLITHASQRLGTVTAEMLSEISVIVVSLEVSKRAVGGFIYERGLARRSEMYDRTVFEQAMSTSKQVPRIAISLPRFLALPGRFGNVCDRSAPARRCLRPRQPDFNPRTPSPPPASRSARSGTSATKATRRRTGCTGGRRSTCAPAPRRNAINL
jgi:hypothetical protein